MKEKPNQDRYSIHHNLGGLPQCHLFIVCDGHGQQGERVAEFVVNQLSKIIKDWFSLHTDFITMAEVLTLEQQMRKFIEIWFQEVEQHLKRSSIEIQHSGSTCVMVLMIGQLIICANCGDSKAAFLSKNMYQADWMSKILSVDHKPEMEMEK